MFFKHLPMCINQNSTLVSFIPWSDLCAFGMFPHMCKKNVWANICKNENPTCVEIKIEILMSVFSFFEKLYMCNFFNHIAIHVCNFFLTTCVCFWLFLLQYIAYISLLSGHCWITRVCVGQISPSLMGVSTESWVAPCHYHAYRA